MAISLRERFLSVIKNGKQNFPASLPSFVRTPRRVAIERTRVRTIQSLRGAVTMKRSISDSLCVAYIARELETATIRSQGIHLMDWTKSRVFWKSSCSSGEGDFFTPRKDSSFFVIFCMDEVERWVKVRIIWIFSFFQIFPLTLFFLCVIIFFTGTFSLFSILWHRQNDTSTKI